MGFQINIMEGRIPRRPLCLASGWLAIAFWGSRHSTFASYADVRGLPPPAEFLGHARDAQDDVWGGRSDSRLWTLDIRPLGEDIGLWTLDFRPLGEDYGLWTLDEGRERRRIWH